MTKMHYQEITLISLLWTMTFLRLSATSGLRTVPACTEAPGPKDCEDLLVLQGDTSLSSGVYRIWPDAWPIVGSFQVYCDMSTDGGGWTLVQRRGQFKIPDDYFYKTWNEYKNGFGSIEKEFWIGNDRLFALTNQNAYELRIDMWDDLENWAYAKYGTFWIENEDQLYRLHIANYTSTNDTGDSFGSLSQKPFSTKDRDNDEHEQSSCAQMYKGGWWYTKCHSANLNGLNLRGYHEKYATGINWRTWKGYHNSLLRVEMKIRPANRLQNV